MIVDAVTPTYFTAGWALRSVAITGRHFELIPDGAVGFLSESNDDPERHKGSDQGRYKLNIVSRTGSEIVLEQSEGYSLATSYLGCIASEDGSEVYWVNNTSPLP